MDQGRLEGLREQLASQADALEASGATDAARQVREALARAAAEVEQARASLEDARRQAEAERLRYQELFEHAPDAYLLTDREGVLLEVNARAAELLGLSPDRGGDADRPRDNRVSTGLDVRSFVVESEREAFERELRVLLARGGRGEWRTTMRPRGGSPISASLSVVPARDGSGAFVGLRWIVRDRTEADRAREALRRERDFAETLIETARAAVLVLDTQGRVLRFNPYMEELSGYRLRELRGADGLAAFVAEEQRETTREAFTRALVSRSSSSLTCRLPTKDGTFREVEWFASPLRDAVGRVVGMLAVGHDLTERKRLEQELLQAQKMEAIGQLSGGIAHDFNNLLMGIMGCASIALNKLTPDHPAHKFIEEVRNAAMRGAALPSQLLAFSRKREVAPSVLDLGAVVSKTEKMLRRMLGEDIDLRVELGGEPSHVLADQGQLEQVLMNLAVNARDAMPDGGHLTVRTSIEHLDEAAASRCPGLSPGAHVVLVVRDDGCGMDETTRARVFEPFFTTKAVGQGTGLGLSTVYGIVKQSGGHVSLESEVGRGTTFTIRLPQVEPPSHELSTGGWGAGPQRGHETVLLVEDEPLVRMTIRHYLERWGYAVIEAGDGAEALEAFHARSREIDLVLTDMVLPHVGGAELAGRLREADPRVRILFMSAYASDQLLGERGAAPIEVSLRKPFTEDALLASIQKALGKPEAPVERAPPVERRARPRGSRALTLATG